MPADQKAMFMGYEKIIDFYVCAESDVFVPSILGSFYSGIVGKRIGDGKTQTLVPGKSSSAAETGYMSQYITKRSHFAYSCFC